jgi:antitoxin component YwqK of YwqJK toxin-antitoxin module
MKVTFSALRTAGAIGIALMSYTAMADTTENAPSPLRGSEATVLPEAAKPKTAHSVPTRAAAEGMLDVGKLETATELFPNGKVKIEREVGQDSAGNYFNQGSYKQYAITGEIVRQGEFVNGKLTGKWTQNLLKDEGHLFSAGQDSEILAPFISEATFQDGRLHGVWTIKDFRGQNLIQWSFENGVRAGTWTWWYANGQKRLEAAYISGALNGDVTEWDREGKIINQDTYIDGKCVVKAVKWYTLGQKHFEGNYLHATGMPEATYDWWNSKIVTANTPADVADQQHGTWTEWYPSGNKKAEGHYDRGIATGRFTWWYENGQKQAEGDFENGLKNGTWITWHANGLKESMGEYRANMLVGKALTWSADGKLVESREENQQQQQNRQNTSQMTVRGRYSR